MTQDLNALSTIREQLISDMHQAVQKYRWTADIAAALLSNSEHRLESRKLFDIPDHKTGVRTRFLVVVDEESASKLLSCLSDQQYSALGTIQASSCLHIFNHKTGLANVELRHVDLGDVFFKGRLIGSSNLPAAVYQHNCLEVEAAGLYKWAGFSFVHSSRRHPNRVGEWNDQNSGVGQLVAHLLNGSAGDEVVSCGSSDVDFATVGREWRSMAMATMPTIRLGDLVPALNSPLVKAEHVAPHLQRNSGFLMIPLSLSVSSGPTSNLALVSKKMDSMLKHMTKRMGLVKHVYESIDFSLLVRISILTVNRKF